MKKKQKQQKKESWNLLLLLLFLLKFMYIFLHAFCLVKKIFIMIVNSSLVKTKKLEFKNLHNEWDEKLYRIFRINRKTQQAVKFWLSLDLCKNLKLCDKRRMTGVWILFFFFFCCFIEKMFINSLKDSKFIGWHVFKII